MKLHLCKDPVDLGAQAAKLSAQILNEAIARKGSARLVLSTGASQFDTLKSLVKEDVDWTKVEMFHLDEYVSLPMSHKASFRLYLTDRFIQLLPASLKAVHFVNGEGDVQANIAALTEEIRKAPIDLGLIGIGENAHIAFNDPPADFDTKEAYLVVNLDDKCKAQQVGEGWFETPNDVPKQAISMSVYQIMQCEAIISCVPYPVKADAVKLTLENELTNRIPATMLKTHPRFDFFIDADSAAKVDPSKYGA